VGRSLGGDRLEKGVFWDVRVEGRGPKSRASRWGDLVRGA